MINTINIIKLLASILLLSAISPAYAEIYKWVDKNGAPHFSDQPPDEEQVVYEKIRTESDRKNGYLATGIDGNEYLWSDYVDQGDKYCIPIRGGHLCIYKYNIASIRKITGRRKKDFDAPMSAITKGSADRKRSPDEEALDDDEEQYPERTGDLPKPPRDDFSLKGAGRICRYAVLHMSIPVSTVYGSQTYRVKTADRTSILPYKDKFGRYGHRFCFSTGSFAPGVKIGLLRYVLCSIYKVGDEWRYELKDDCSFMQ